jgi:hypothetical protein
MLYYVPILSIDEVTQKRAFLGGVFLEGADEDDASRAACRIARRDKNNPLLDLETMVTECNRTIVTAGKDRLLSPSELEFYCDFDADTRIDDNGTAITIKRRKTQEVQ